MFLRRIVGLFALLFGVIGVAACGAGGYGVWRVQSRLNQANDKAAGVADRGMSTVQERIPLVQQRVKQARLTTDDLKEALGEWAKKEARERIVAKLEVDVRVEKLAGHLHAADLRLDASEMAVRDVRQLLELGQSLGASVDPAATDDVLAIIAQLKGSLSEADQALNEVRKFADPDRETVEERLARVAKILVRILATFVEVDERLERCSARLTELRAEAQELHKKTGNYILLGALACYAILVWIAAGQVALTRWGWSCIRRRPASETPPSVAARS